MPGGQSCLPTFLSLCKSDSAVTADRSPGSPRSGRLGVRTERLHNGERPLARIRLSNCLREPANVGMLGLSSYIRERQFLMCDGSVRFLKN